MVAAKAFWVANAAVATTADARNSLGRMDRIWGSSCVVHHPSDLKKLSRQIAVQKASRFSGDDAQVLLAWGVALARVDQLFTDGTDGAVLFIEVGGETESFLE